MCLILFLNGGWYWKETQNLLTKHFDLFFSIHIWLGRFRNAAHDLNLHQVQKTYSTSLLCLTFSYTALNLFCINNQSYRLPFTNINKDIFLFYTGQCWKLGSTLANSKAAKDRSWHKPSQTNIKLCTLFTCEFLEAVKSSEKWSNCPCPEEYLTLVTCRA